MTLVEDAATPAADALAPWLEHRHRWQPGPYVEAEYSVPTMRRSRRMVKPPSVVLACTCGAVERVRVPDRVRAEVSK